MGMSFRKSESSASTAALRATAVFGWIVACSLGGGAWAGAGPEADDATLEELVVVGSRLATTNASTISPVVTVDSEEFAHQGTTRAEDLLNSLPQLNSGLTESANGAGVTPLTGTATADLRGIGSFNTLVLMNGRRLQPGDSINPSPDVSAIPSILVKRVEVLTGGASSIYGSDAISGVVNFVMDTGFTGAKLEAQYGINRASNGDGFIQGIEQAQGIAPRTGTVYDGGNADISGVYGTDLFGGQGHVVAYAGFRHSQGIFGSSRDFSGCTLQETATSFQCLLDGTTPGGQFVPNGGAGSPLTLDRANPGAFRAFDPATDSYNPAPFQTLSRPDTRYDAGMFGSYKLGGNAEAYWEATYSEDKTTVFYEPSGTSPTGSLNTFGVNCNNPLLSASEVAALCTQYGLGAADTAQVSIGRRNVEGGFRQDEFRHSSYRLLLGVKGELNEVWNYDFNGQFGNTNSHERMSNDFSQQRLANALNVVSVGGVPTCQSVVDGSDPACVPYNIFGTGPVTAAARNYVSASGAQDGYARQYDFNGQLIGLLGKYGIKSPFADDGVSLAAGAEFRSQTISNQPNDEYLTGDLVAASPARVTLGTYHVAEVFAETRIPLLQNKLFAKSLSLNLSDRFAEYSPQGPANAYNFGVDWAPVDLVRLRGTVSRAVRAPNGHELFLAQALSRLSIIDPCANDPTTGLPTASAATCARTGVTAAQYGKIPAANTINYLSGGNPNLRPQIGNTVTAGVVLTPLGSTRALYLSADYWRIKIEKYIGSLPAGPTFLNCLNSGDPLYCSLVQRDANGSLSTGNGAGAGHVVATGINTGSFEMSGVDLAGRYVLDIGDANLGKVSFTFTGSLALDNTIQTTPGQIADCTGYFGQFCTGAGPTSPIPKWRHKLRTTWEVRPGSEVSLNWRHIGPLDSEHLSSNPLLASTTAYPVDSHVGAYDYLDADIGFDVGSHVELRFGVNNLLDRQPPVVGFVANPQLVNGNMLAGIYDTFGRYLFVGVTAKY